MSEERMHVIPEQAVQIPDFSTPGPVLDIGGGGEGLVGRIKGDRVIAIDLSSAELLEAPAGPIKIVMDARELSFVEHSFSVATALFSMMYLTRQDRRQVFREIRRVQAPGPPANLGRGDPPDS